MRLLIVGGTRFLGRAIAAHAVATGRRAVAALKQRAAHWSFLSTVSVYTDNHTTRQRADTAPVLAPLAPEIEQSTPETYGAAKVACHPRG